MFADRADSESDSSINICNPPVLLLLIHWAHSRLNGSVVAVFMLQNALRRLVLLRRVTIRSVGLINIAWRRCILLRCIIMILVHDFFCNMHSFWVSYLVWKTASLLRSSAAVYLCY